MNGDVYNEPRHAKEIVGVGALAGLVGGLVMSAALAVAAGVEGVRLTEISRGIAQLAGGSGDAALGLVVHLAVAAAWGIVFAWLIGRATRLRNAVVAAIAYGIAVWAIMVHVVAPSVTPYLASVLEPIPHWALIVVHITYGLPLAFVPSLQRRIAKASHERATPRHPWVGRTVTGEGS